MIGTWIGILLLYGSVGIGFVLEVFLGGVPCSLCFLQRGCMLLTALGLYWNLAYGQGSRYYAFALFSSLLGLAASLRHAGLNVCKTPGEGTLYFCSFRIYTWSFLIFFCSLLGIACLLFFQKKTIKSSGRLSVTAAVVFLIVSSICVISILFRRGFNI